MNERSADQQRQANEQERRARRVLKSGAVLLAAEIAILGCAQESSAHTPEWAVETVVQNAETLPQDLSVLIVDAPHTKRLLRDEAIREEMTKATHALDLTTDSSVSLKVSGFDHIRVDPVKKVKDQTGKEVRCYPYDQTRSLEKVYRKNRHLGDAAIVAVVMNGDIDCSGYDKSPKYPAGAYANPVDKYIVMNQLGAEVHEIGHVLGLPHAKKVNVLTSAGSDFDSGFDAVDFRAMTYVLDDGLTESDAKNKKLSLGDRRARRTYTSKDSVMGSRSTQFNTQLFTVDELNEIDPSRFKILDIQPEPGEYKLSMDRGGIAGVRLPVSEKSGLKSVDKDITHVVFGLQVEDLRYKLTSLTDSRAGLGVTITARGNEALYTLAKDSTFHDSVDEVLKHRRPHLGLGPFMRENSTGEFRYTDYMYVDPSEGIIVSQYQDEDGNIIIRVDNRETSAAGRESLRQEKARREAAIHEANPR